LFNLSPPKPSTNCTALAVATRWWPCASVVARGLRRFSNAS